MKKLLLILLILFLVGCSNPNKSYLLSKKEAKSLGLTEFSITQDLVTPDSLYNGNINGFYWYSDPSFVSLSLYIYTFPSKEKLERQYNGSIKTDESYIKNFLVSENKFGEKSILYKFDGFKLFFVKKNYLIIIGASEEIPQETVEKIAKLTANKI